MEGTGDSLGEPGSTAQKDSRCKLRSDLLGRRNAVGMLFNNKTF